MSDNESIFVEVKVRLGPLAREIKLYNQKTNVNKYKEIKAFYQKTKRRHLIDKLMQV
jgi:hypothetical protein